MGNGTKALFMCSDRKQKSFDMLKSLDVFFWMLLSSRRLWKACRDHDKSRPLSKKYRIKRSLSNLSVHCFGTCGWLFYLERILKTAAAATRRRLQQWFSVHSWKYTIKYCTILYKWTGLRNNCGCGKMALQRNSIINLLIASSPKIQDI